MEIIQIILDGLQIGLEVGELGGIDRGWRADLALEVGGEDMGDGFGSFEAGFLGVGVELSFEFIWNGDGDFGHRSGGFRGRNLGGKW